MRKERCHGFTLVELLVVIAIIGILISLLLPAVQAAREAARRIQCTNHLKQLALACHNYHTAHSTFPISIGPWKQGNNPSAECSGKGWIVSILPYIEANTLYDQFEVGFNGHFFNEKGIMDPACREALKTPLAALQCPSDLGQSEWRISKKEHQIRDFKTDGSPAEAFTTNYKGCIGDTQMGGKSSIHTGTLPDCHSKNDCNGIFYRLNYQDGGIRISDITDGTTTTFLIGEDVPKFNSHSAAYYSNGDYASCHAPLNYFPDGVTVTRTKWPNVISFRSMHSGGASFAMADASVHFFSESIDHDLYRSLSTKAGGEIASIP